MEDIIDDVALHCTGAECYEHEEHAADVDGFTSRRVKCLLNTLVRALPDGEAYLEIGCYKGATLIGALTGNKPTAAYAVDDWSEYDSADVFLANLKLHRPDLPDVDMFIADCFTLDASKFPAPVGVYFYDGAHTPQAQSKAITHFWPVLAQHAVIVVDDWNWWQVRYGTWDGFERVKPGKVHFRELPARCNGDTEWFHNGLGVFYVEK